MSALVALARERGSTATTPAGALRYLRRQIASVSPIPIPTWETSRARAIEHATIALERATVVEGDALQTYQTYAMMPAAHRDVLGVGLHGYHQDWPVLLDRLQRARDARSNAAHARHHATRPLAAPHSRRAYDRIRDEERAARICRDLGLPERPDSAERASLLSQLAPTELERACWQDGGLKVGPYAVSAAEAVAEILRRVGPAGDQARADEARYLESYDVAQYSSRKHRGRDWRGISLAVVRSDGAAAILSYVEAGSYLHKDRGAGGLHHLRIHAYLVVRDATSGDRHVLRVPPRFGSTRSATFRRLRGDALIHAATAWTFGLAPEAYHPEIAA